MIVAVRQSRNVQQRMELGIPLPSRAASWIAYSDPGSVSIWMVRELRKKLQRRWFSERWRIGGQVVTYK
jgi:hypothetical protein